MSFEKADVRHVAFSNVQALSLAIAGGNEAPTPVVPVRRRWIDGPMAFIPGARKIPDGRVRGRQGITRPAMIWPGRCRDGVASRLADARYDGRVIGKILNGDPPRVAASAFKLYSHQRPIATDLHPARSSGKHGHRGGKHEN